MVAGKITDEGLRDGKETLPEPLDLPLPKPPVQVHHPHKTEADIDESLEESFPASDPPSSGYTD